MLLQGASFLKVRGQFFLKVRVRVHFIRYALHFLILFLQSHNSVLAVFRIYEDAPLTKNIGLRGAQSELPQSKNPEDQCKLYPSLFGTSFCSKTLLNQSSATTKGVLKKQQLLEIAVLGSCQFYLQSKFLKNTSVEIHF